MTSRFVAAFAGLAVTSVAVADTVDLRYIGKGNGRDVTVNVNGNSFDVFSGELIHEFSNGTGIGAGLTGQMITFCPDLMETVTSDGDTYDIVGVDQVPVTSGQPQMGGQKAQAIVDVLALADGATAITTADNFYSALQLVIWEIVMDYDSLQGESSVNVTSGQLLITETNGASLSSDVVVEMSAIASHIGDGRHLASAMAFANDGDQDQLLPVPAPGTAMLALGLLGLGARRRR